MDRVRLSGNAMRQVRLIRNGLGDRIRDALSLADGADYIDTNEDTAFEFALSSFSIVAFIKTSVVPAAAGGIAAHWKSNIGHRILLYPTTKLLTVYLQGTGGNATTNNATTPADGTWHQVAIIVDRSANRLWVACDGARTNWADISTVGDVSCAANLILGNWDGVTPADKSLSGSMACTHVYPRALVDADLAAIYAAPDTPLSNCLAFWQGDIDGNTIAETAGDAGGPYTATGSGVEADPDGFSL